MILSLVFGTVIQAIIIKIFYYDFLIHIPPDKRDITPQSTWITLIPFLGMLYQIFLFIVVFPGIFEIYADTEHMDTNIVSSDKLKTRGKIWGSSTILLLIAVFALPPSAGGPLGLIFGGVGFVAFVGYLIQIHRIKKILPEKEYHDDLFSKTSNSANNVDDNAKSSPKSEKSIADARQTSSTMSKNVEQRKEVYSLLKELRDLHETGAITEEEFKAEKQKLLNN